VSHECIYCGTELVAVRAQVICHNCDPAPPLGDHVIQAIHGPAGKHKFTFKEPCYPTGAGVILKEVELDLDVPSNRMVRVALERDPSGELVIRLSKSLSKSNG
jgi:hypothetical protein